MGAPRSAERGTARRKMFRRRPFVEWMPLSAGTTFALLLFGGLAFFFAGLLLFSYSTSLAQSVSFHYAGGVTLSSRAILLVTLALSPQVQGKPAGTNPYHRCLGVRDIELLLRFG